MNQLFKYFLEKFKKWNVSRLSLNKIWRIKRHLIYTKLWGNIYDYGLIKQHKHLWSGYGLRVRSIWLKVYTSISENIDHKYIPENIYYAEIEPRLNNKFFSKAYTDKNNYHKLLDANCLPKIFLRSISGTFYAQDYSKITEINDFLNNLEKGKEYIIKPSIEGGGGYEVRKITNNEDGIIIKPDIDGINSLSGLLTYYCRDYVLQEYINQHSFFSSFNPDSLNTIRILTYRSFKDDEIKILHRIFRIGRPGHIVDNQASGGIACGINKNGVLNDFGVDKYGNKYFEVNNIRLSTVGLIPFIKDIENISTNIGKQFLYSRLLGLDFTVDKNGKVLLIEINDNNNEINFYQMNNGPLFSEYSEEVATFCKNEPKSFLIDFYIS